MYRTHQPYPLYFLKSSVDTVPVLYEYGDDDSHLERSSAWGKWAVPVPLYHNTIYPLAA